MGKTAELLHAAPEVLHLLCTGGQTLAVAESLTGGALCAAFVEVPGASDVFRGGIVSYVTDLKSALLGVDRELLAAVGPVNDQVAVQMAQGAARSCSADFGVATTGVAGPGPADGHPAGTVHVAVWHQRHGSWHRKLQLSGERNEVRSGAVRGALQLLYEAVSATARKQDGDIR